MTQFQYVSDIIKNTKDFPGNPFKIQAAVYEHLKNIMGDKIPDKIDPTSPFSFDLESAAVLTSAFISYDNDLNRKQYPAAAMTEEDLYLHMCDKDYIGRFALPTTATFNFLMRVDEVSSHMVYDPDADLRKVIIPRNTFIVVGGTTYTMEYPVEIREMKHGGIQILIDHKIASPIQVLKTNTVDFDIRLERSDIPHGRDIKWLQFSLELTQVTVTPYEFPVSRAVAFNRRIDLTDHYYYARVFYQDQNSVWQEMLTTHAPDVYDVAKPTAVLKVLDNSLRISIPQVYSDLGYLDTKIRVDVYETKGEVNMDLSGYEPTEFSVTFRAIDGRRDRSAYTAPMPKLGTFTVYSNDLVSGGREPLSFKALRERVIENSVGIRHIPISNIQIEDYLEDNGFRIIKNIDQVTNRAYLASRSLPPPSNERLLTSAAASIEALNTSLDGLIATGYVYQNEKAITISPEAVYESSKGILSILPKSEVRSILALPTDEKVSNINSRNLYRSPFHYVLDMSERVFDFRAYYLDHPKADNKSFVDSNDTTQLLQITITNYQIERIEKGYRLVVVAKGDAMVARIDDSKMYTQLAFIPPGEIDYAYINGRFIGKEGENRVFEYIIETNYHVRKTDYIELTNAKMYNLDDRIVPSRLMEEFDILFATNEALSQSWRSSPIDRKLGKFLLPTDTKAIVNERIRITLGYPLHALWKRCRTLAGSEVYETWDRDVYLTYDHDVLDTDTASSLSVNNGNVEYKIKHHKGDTVLGPNGKPILKHKKGDIKFKNSLPVLINNRKILVQLDVMLLEWVYFIADHPVIQEYRKNMIDIYVDWIVDSLEDVNDRVLEQTRIYFYPRATLGQVEVMYNDGIQTRINAAQRLTIDLVVRPQVYANYALRQEITKATTKVINGQLDSGMVATNEILSSLTKEYGFDVIGVDMHGLGGNDRIITFTVLDDSKRCSLKKRLTAETNDILFIEEDVTVNFIEHAKKKL